MGDAIERLTGDNRHGGDGYRDCILIEVLWHFQQWSRELEFSGEELLTTTVAPALPGPYGGIERAYP